MISNDMHAFSRVPANVDIQRSKINRPSSLKTSFNNGQLVPIYAEEVLPGSTFSMTTKCALRLSTLIKPIMDDLYCDIYYFFVPNRIIWSDFKEFMGEQNDPDWDVISDKQVPHFFPYLAGALSKSLSDYLGILTVSENVLNDNLYFHFNDLFRRAYYLVFNEWFRDQNLQKSVYFDRGSSSFVQTSDDFVSDDTVPLEQYYAHDMLCPVNKMHDYFSSALPKAQKGPDVSLINVEDGLLPVVTSNNLVPFNQFNNIPLEFSEASDPTLTVADGTALVLGNVSGSGDNTSQTLKSYNSSEYPYSDGIGYVPRNLYASLNASSGIQTINDLRIAFATQRYFERAARSGTRYREYLKAFFGVTSPDATMQVPEYLGGTRFRVNINQVVQTSSSSVESPQGNVSAYSLTNEYNESFTKSFTEHGILIGVACTRHKHTYQDGINRMFLRRDLFDYYNPTFANIGEQPIRRVEIYGRDLDADITDFENDANGIFGYQEAWAEYRYKPSLVTGEMRSNYAQSLDIWHLADEYSSRPYLNDKWVREPKEYLDRVLAVTSDISDQFQADFMFDCTCVLPMPLYSVPGLLDHN